MTVVVSGDWRHHVDSTSSLAVHRSLFWVGNEHFWEMKEKLNKTLFSFHLGTRQKHLQNNYFGEEQSRDNEEPGSKSMCVEHGKGSPALLCLWFNTDLEHLAPPSYVKVLRIRLLAFLGSFLCYIFSLLSLTDTQTTVVLAEKNRPFWCLFWFFYQNGCKLK